MKIRDKLRKRRYDLGKTQEWVAFEAYPTLFQKQKNGVS